MPACPGDVPFTPSVPSAPLSPLLPLEPLAPEAPLAPVTAPFCKVRSTNVSVPPLTSKSRVFAWPSRTTDMPDASRVTDPVLSVIACVNAIVPLQANWTVPPAATAFCKAANVHLVSVFAVASAARGTGLRGPAAPAGTASDTASMHVRATTNVRPNDGCCHRSRLTWRTLAMRCGQKEHAVLMSQRAYLAGGEHLARLLPERE